jgi:sugar phosphate isomerase/epimerase
MIRAIVGLGAIVVTAAVPAAFAQRAHVQVGYCTSLKNLAAAQASGFDYGELGTTEIAGLAEADFEQAAHDVAQVGLPTPVANLFLPATLKVTGPAIDRDQQIAYVTKAFDRLSRLGVRTVVFGSGGARRVPEGFPRDDAFRQLVDFGKRAAIMAREHGITLAVEPLRREETNIVNSAAEGLQLVEAIDDPNFQLMIDFYHLASEHEDPGIIIHAHDHLRHLHIANPKGRVFPLSFEEFDYEPFFAALRTIGYDRRISVEASTRDLQSDAPRAITLLRRAL